MGGGVRTVSFSWDGSFVVGGSDEGTGIEIVSLILLEVSCVYGFMGLWETEIVGRGIGNGH